MDDDAAAGFFQGRKAAEPEAGNPYQDNYSRYEEEVEEVLALFEHIWYHDGT
jgi:hypothetical protein